MNFGNFLWAASGYSLRIEKVILKIGAQYNSLFGSTNRYPGQWDSKDDQLSIDRGKKLCKK